MANDKKIKRLVISALDYNPKSVKIDKHIYDARPMTNRELDNLKDGLTPETFDYFIEDILKPRQVNKAKDIRKATLGVPFNQWYRIVQVFIAPENIAYDKNANYLRDFKAEKDYSVITEVINAKGQKIEIKGIPLTIGEFLAISNVTTSVLPEIDGDDQEAVIQAVVELNASKVKAETVDRINNAFNRIIGLRLVDADAIDIPEFVRDMPPADVTKVQEFLVDPNQNVGNEDKDEKN